MEKMISTDSVADAMEDRAGCSCIEGNACVDRYRCKDWENREKVAANIRNDKRYGF